MFARLAKLKPQTVISWLYWLMPGWMVPYADLVRLDRPIGTWLLLLPCWWGVALAADKGHWPDVWYMFLFAAGAGIMRGAGCIVNDIYDRKLDARVERTRNRPLASGAVKLWQAIVFLATLLFLGLCILLFFNYSTIFLAIMSLVLVATYPLMKRITWWPQLFLGLTFNWGALLGWVAVRGEVELPTMLLYAAGILWTLGYDTVYAHQDKRDDVKVGIKSTALLFGTNSRQWVAGFYAGAIVLLAATGVAVGLGVYYYLALIGAALFAAYEMLVWDMDDPANCLLRFRRNRDFGLIVLAGIIVDRLI